MTSTECQCCYLDFSNSQSLIPCGCGFTICGKCIKTYLIGSTSDADCMSCHRAFDQGFLCDAVSSGWVNGAYKKHKSKIIRDKEMARLSSSQPAAKRVLDIIEKDKELLIIQQEIYDVRYKYKVKEGEKHRLTVAHMSVMETEQIERFGSLNTVLFDMQGEEMNVAMKDAVDELAASVNATAAKITAKHVLDIIEKGKELLTIKREINAVQNKYNAKARERRSLNVATPIVRKQFLHKCGVDGCLGSLSTAWKCEMCDTYSCSKCHAIKGPNRDAGHTCNPADVSSVEEIKKSTRDCPSCATSIYKIEGCDQMFCTMPGCETAFSFRTGRRETGRVHNPHFIEMQQQGLIAGDGNARAPGDRLCGGGPTANFMRALVIKTGARIYSRKELLDHNDPEMRYRGDADVETFRDPWAHKLLENIYRGSIHFNDVIVDRLRTRVTTAMDNEDLRVSLLLKRINEKKFMSNLMRRDKKRCQDQALLHIMELFSTVLQEQLRRVTRGATVARRHGEGRFARPYTYTLPSAFDGVSKEEIKSDIQSAHQEVERVRLYCNEHLEKIGADFKVNSKYIPENPCKLMRI
jgi:hypothetical protein